MRDRDGTGPVVGWYESNADSTTPSPRDAGVRARELRGSPPFWLYRERGQLADLEPLIGASVDADPNIIAFRTAFALVLAELGRRDGAKQALELLTEGRFAHLQRGNTWPVSLALLAEVSARVQDVDRSQQILEALASHRGHLVVRGPAGVICLGAVDRYLGMLLWVMGRPGETEELFRSALVLEERVGAPPFLARTRFWYARLLLDRRSPGDIDKAAKHLAAALEGAQRFGMVKLALEVEQVACE